MSHHSLHSGILKYFPTPGFLTLASVGMEITPDTVRFLELLETGGGHRIGRYGSYEVPEQAVDEENFPSGEALRGLLSDIRERHKLNLVSVALPEEKTYIFRAEVPSVSPEEMRESLELKLEEYVPIPPREAVFDYQIVNVLPGDRVAVSVSVVPRLIVERYLDFFTSAKLTPVSFQVSAQAIVNAIIPHADRAPVIVVNFGKEKTGLYLVSDRVVHFTSTVLVGGDSFTEAIRKYFSVSAKEAEKIKEERGISGKKENAALFSSLVSTLSALRDEVEKISSYWETHIERYSDVKQKITRVVLCGKESSLQGLPEYFEASLSMRAELANVWANALSLDSYIPPISRKDSLSFASVIGLSLNEK